MGEVVRLHLRVVTCRNTAVSQSETEGVVQSVPSFVALSSSAMIPALLHKTSIPSGNFCLISSAAFRTELKSIKSQSMAVIFASLNSALMVLNAASERSDL